jgi:ribokinase
MQPQVVVVGSFVQDLTWRCPAFPRPGETVMGEFVTGPGGKGSNQAVAAARAGARTLFVGAVGRDAFASEAKRFYRANGIGARFAEKPRHATGTAGILVDTAGQNQIVVALGANAHLRRSDVPLAALRRARIVVTQLESNLTTTAQVLREAKRAGVTTLLNPAPMRADFDPAILRHVDVLVPNETEFAELVRRRPGGSPEGFSAAALATATVEEIHPLCRSLGVPTVIVTLGQRGCVVSREEGAFEVPAFRVKAVDTTGAGDAFVGGFAAGWVSTGDLAEAARYGCAVAALSVTRFGTAPAMPTQEEVRVFTGGRRGGGGRS